MSDVLDESERVLVIPRDQLFNEDAGRRVFQGFFKGTLSFFEAIFENAHLIYRPRSLVETEVNYKQLIPYVYILKQDKILGYQRTKKAGESRLHGKWSVGFGGHMNDGDKDFAKALAREVVEEVNLDNCEVVREGTELVGFINDDSTEVGQVHFGVVCSTCIISGEPKATKDEGLTNLCWKTVDEWLELDLESWSRLVIENHKLNKA